MTITVVTRDYGALEFDADDWDSDSESRGHLWIGDKESGEGVAEFASGTWAYVFEKKKEQKKPEQVAVLTRDCRGRKWVDQDGWAWEYNTARAKWVASIANCAYGPYYYPDDPGIYWDDPVFTEIIEESK
jgi:ligand-binding sensor domain-containing protein